MLQIALEKGDDEHQSVNSFTEKLYEYVYFI